MRVVSLVPSVTETLLAWGVTPVAVTRFCEQPDLRQVGGTKDPDVGAIIALAPDLVVLCEEENRIEDAIALERAGLRTLSLAIESLADVDPALAALATAVGAAPTALARADARSPSRLAQSGEVVPSREVGEPGEAGAHLRRVRAFVPIWRRPWMTIGGATYGASLLAHLGVDTVLADSVARYPEVTLEQAAAARPDVVLAPSEPYPFSTRHVAELEQVAPVELVDGQDLFWWGVRTPAALARLRERLADLTG